MTWVVRIVKKLSFLLLLSLFASNIYADVDIGAIDPAEEIGWASSTQLLPNSDGGLLVRTNAGSNRLTLDSSGNCTLAASVTATSNVTLGASGVFSFNGSTETVANGNGGFIVRTSADAARLTLTSAGNLTAAGSVTATTNATLGASSVLSFSGSTEFVANGDGGFISRTAADSPTLTLSSSGNLSAVGSVTAGTFLSAPEQASDPSAPSGAFKVWQSNGTGTGDDGDIYVSINDGSTTNTALLYDFSANAFQGSGGGGGLAEEDLDDVTSGQEIGWDSSTDLVNNGDGGLIVRADDNTATMTLTSAGELTITDDINAANAVLTGSATLGAASVLSYSGGTEVVANGDGGLIVRNAADTARLTLNSSGELTPSGGLVVGLNTGAFLIGGAYGNGIGFAGGTGTAASAEVGVFNTGLVIDSDSVINWTNASNSLAASRDLALARDAANTLGLRNSTNAQALNIYNTYTDASNYERVGLYFSGNRAHLATSAGGTGTDRGLTIDAADLNFSNLPTSDPSVAGQLWNDAGTLKVSAGP